MGDRFFNEKKEIENDKIIKILSVTGMYTKLLPETENSEGTFYFYMITIQTCKSIGDDRKLFYKNNCFVIVDRPSESNAN